MSSLSDLSVCNEDIYEHKAQLPVPIRLGRRQRRLMFDTLEPVGELGNLEIKGAEILLKLLLDEVSQQ